MKELYFTPEVTLVSFVSAEKLATGVGGFDFDDAIGGVFDKTEESGDLNSDYNL